MSRRLGITLLVGVLAVACGPKRSAAPAPQTMQESLTAFLAAVKDSNINRMGQLWGSEQGPAASWMDPARLQQMLMTIHKYWTHTGYRIVEGPIPFPGNDRMRTFRVELQRPNCARVVPVDVIQARNGGWLVKDVHLESVGNPRMCGTKGSGTGP